jgi:hypothetical protein
MRNIKTTILFLSVIYISKIASAQTPCAEGCSIAFKKLETTKVKSDHTTFDLSLSKLDPNYYEYSSESGLRLGSGFNPLENENIKQSPFILKLDTFENVASLSTQLDYVLITSYNQLKEELKVDVKVSAGYGMFGKVDASVNFFRDLNFQTNSIYLLVKGETEYGRVEAKVDKIKPEVIEMLYGAKARKNYVKSNFTLLPNYVASADAIKKFREVYGSKIPIIERHGASVYILIEINNLSREEKQKLDIAINASGSFGLFSAEMKSSISKSIQTKMVNGEVRMKLLTKGGDGFKHLDKILTYISSKTSPANEPLGELGGLIADYLNNFTFNNSAPIGFFCPSYSDLGFSGIDYQDKLEVYNELLEIDNRYLKAAGWISRIDNILNTNSPISLYISAELRTKLTTAKKECFAYIDKLRATYIGIVNSNEIAEIPEFCSAVGFTENDLNISQIRFDANTEASLNPSFVELKLMTTGSKNYQIQGKYLREVSLSWQSDNSKCLTTSNSGSILAPASMLVQYYDNSVTTKPATGNKGVTMKMDGELLMIEIERDFIQNDGYPYKNLIKFTDNKCALDASTSVSMFITITDMFGASMKFEIAKAFPWCSDSGCGTYKVVVFPYTKPLEIKQ